MMNAQELIKSLLNSFPDDLSLSGENASDSSNEINSEDQLSGMLTPIKHRKTSAVTTPSLSLPDSFDVDCSYLVNNLKRNNQVWPFLSIGLCVIHFVATQKFTFDVI